MLLTRFVAPLAVVVGGYFGLSTLVAGELGEAPVVEVGDELARVVSIRRTEMGSRHNRYGMDTRSLISTALFELEDGEEVRLFVPNGGLRRGDQVTLQVSYLEDGSRRYHYAARP